MAEPERRTLKAPAAQPRQAREEPRPDFSRRQTQFCVAGTSGTNVYLGFALQTPIATTCIFDSFTLATSSIYTFLSQI